MRAAWVSVVLGVFGVAALGWIAGSVLESNPAVAWCLARAREIEEHHGVRDAAIGFPAQDSGPIRIQASCLSNGPPGAPSEAKALAVARELLEAALRDRPSTPGLPAVSVVEVIVATPHDRPGEPTVVRLSRDDLRHARRTP